MANTSSSLDIGFLLRIGIGLESGVLVFKIPWIMALIDLLVQCKDTLYEYDAIIGSSYSVIRV